MSRTFVRRSLVLAASVAVGVATVGLGATGTPAQAASGVDAVMLRNIASSRCLDLPAASRTAGTQLAIRTCTAGANQKWTATSSGQLTVGALCVGAAGAGKKPGTKVIVASCTGGADQQWRFMPNGTIVGVDSQLCVDIAAQATANGSRTVLATCAGGRSQQWVTAWPTSTTAAALVNPATVKVAGFEGWGTSLSWGANVVGGWSDAKRNQVADLLFSPTSGLGLNISRYHLGGGLNPNWQALGCGVQRTGSPIPAITDWSADANQRWFLSAAKARGANKAIAFASSPPYWMLGNGCTNGSGATNSLPGYWSYAGDTTGAYLGTSSFSGTTDDSVTINFVGNQIHYYGSRRPDAGIAAFSVDGGAETLVDAYSPTVKGCDWLYATPVLSQGSHTLKVRVTGQKNPASAGVYLTADRAIVLPSWQSIDDQDRGPNVNQMNYHWAGYEDFAIYLARIAQHYRDVDGITLNYLDPINESDATWWTKDGIQEGAHFDWAGQEEITRRTAEALTSLGVTTTKVAVTDGNSTSATLRDYDHLPAATKAMTSAIFAHTYSTQPSDAAALRQKATADGKALWQSEFSTGGGLMGFDAQNMTPALSLAERIVADMNTLRPSAWLLWDGLEAYEANQVNGISWGTIWAKYDDPAGQNYTVAKQYYGFKNFTQFIRPGATFIGSNDDANSVAAYDPAKRRLTIVTTNSGAAARYVAWDLTKFSGVSTIGRYRTSAATGENTAFIANLAPQNGRLVDWVAPGSVTTYVIDNVAIR